MPEALEQTMINLVIPSCCQFLIVLKKNILQEQLCNTIESRVIVTTPQAECNFKTDPPLEARKMNDRSCHRTG